MKKYDKPEEYIRRLECSNEDLRKELKKYKYNEAINYELEKENKILKKAIKWLIKNLYWKTIKKIVQWDYEIDL